MVKKMILFTLTTGGLVSLYFFYNFYLAADFNSEGRYFDAKSGTAYTDNSVAWGLISLFLLSPVAIVIVKSKCSRSNKNIS